MSNNAALNRPGLAGGSDFSESRAEISKTTDKFAPRSGQEGWGDGQDHEGDHPSCWAAIVSISDKIGCVPQTLFEWVKKAEVDGVKRDGVPTEMADRLAGKLRRQQDRELRIARLMLSLFCCFSIMCRERGY